MAMRAVLAITAAFLATGAAAQQAPRTMQQDYDAATALDAGKDHDAALAAWTALEARAKSGSRTRAIALVRKGGALFRLARYDEAAEAATTGLASLPTADASLDEDRAVAHRILADGAFNSLDYAGAAASYKEMERLTSSANYKALALLRLIEAQTFTDPDGARASLARADLLLASATAEASVQAAFARRRAILALNTGDLVTARTESQRAVKLLGGLTSRTDTDDVAARGDAALALILGGTPDRAREYLALTGAGRLPATTFDPAAAMVVPDCGGEAQLKPADLAVVEFTIGKDGSVRYSAPIYAAGGGAVGLEFARAARSWSWTPDQVKQLPPFYRNRVRVEMRCSTAFERPSIGKVLRDDLVAWMGTKGLTVAPEPANAAAALASQRAALAASERAAGPKELAVLPFLLALQDNAVVGRNEQHALAARTLAIARANGAPATALLGLAVIERGTASVRGGESKVWARLVTPLLGQQPFSEDAASRSALRLVLADAEGGSAGTALLRQVADDPALKLNDPMRVGAMVRLASREQAAGNTAAARASFEKSGLAPSQCALLDSPPRFLSAGGTFPQEAMLWGFEGWTQTQFDVDANGKVANERAILSYPAFVFTKAGVETMRGARYSKTFRPDGGLGCGSITQRVRFSMGG
jgi:hypothetical protein